MALTYSIVDSFSIVFLLILFISTREKSVRLTDTRCFRMIVVMTAAALFCDMIGWQLDGNSGKVYCVILWIVNILCYVLSGAMALSWLYYTALKLNRLTRISRVCWALTAFPCLFLAVVSALSPWTHRLFYLDERNTYQRGALFFLQMVVPFGYILAAALWALYRAGRERLRQQRMDYLYLSSFIIFPMIGGILQLAFYGVSLAWPCTALSLMLVYVGMQNQKISLDALTGLNNLGQLDKHLYGCIERADGDLRFALFMLDIDEFKKINDEHGHTAGDAALIDAAAILKSSVSGTNSFLSRYGGDEFAIVLYYTFEEELEALVSKIREESEKHGSNGSAPYRLVFSVGYVCYDRKRYSSYQDMITAADARMYLQKRQHKAGRR